MSFTSWTSIFTTVNNTDLPNIENEDFEFIDAAEATEASEDIEAEAEDPNVFEGFMRIGGHWNSVAVSQKQSSSPAVLTVTRYRTVLPVLPS